MDADKSLQHHFSSALKVALPLFSVTSMLVFTGCGVQDTASTINEANALIKAGEAEKALSKLSTKHMLNQSNPSIYYNRGVENLVLKKKEEAV